LLELIIAQTITNYDIHLTLNNARLLENDQNTIEIKKELISEYNKNDGYESFINNIIGRGNYINTFFLTGRFKIIFDYCADPETFFYLYYSLFNYKEDIVDQEHKNHEGLIFVLTDSNNNIYDFHTHNIRIGSILNLHSGSFMFDNPCLFLPAIRLVRDFNIDQDSFPRGQVKSTFELFKNNMNINLENNSLFNQEYNNYYFIKYLYDNPEIHYLKLDFYLKKVL